MKEHDDILTFDETERLCRMYLECGLSVLEEAELKYLLGNVSYSSEIIAGQTGENQVVAYEAGHKLDDEEACVAVRNSMEKAEALMAKAEAIERQYTEKQIQIMNLK